MNIYMKRVLLAAILLVSLLHCDSPQNSFLVFSLVWPWDSESHQASISRISPMADYAGVDFVRAQLWDSTGLVQEQEHVYSLHEGRMRVDPGTYVLRIDGLDAGRNVVYRGEVESVELVKGQTNDVGEIAMASIESLPDAPSDLVASPVSSSQIQLQWTDNSDNEEEFRIQRGLISQIQEHIASVPSNVTFYQDTGLDCETTYQYSVRGYNAFGGGEASNTVSATTLTCPGSLPSAPSDLISTFISSSQTILAWADNSANEDGFIVERKTGADGTYTQIGATDANESTYEDNSVECEILYYYRVSAYNGAGSSDYSNEISITQDLCPTEKPEPPSDLTVVIHSQTSCYLSWVDNSDNEYGFEIERKLEEGSYSQIGMVEENITIYDDTGLEPGTVYFYRVRAYNSAGNSDYSNEESATTEKPPVGSMELIPTGCFDMGDHFNEGDTDELPVHNVCISEFYMDVYEVTNAHYKQCVDAGICTAPGLNSSETRTSYYGNSDYDNYPVIYVDYNQANDYCGWLGKRLPTEAEWEYAARGGLSGKRYPWGDSISCDDADYARLDSERDCYGYGSLDNDTHAVGSYTSNGYGLFDVAGNVWEWVSDWYGGNYYSVSPTNDPQGPSSGDKLILRGGAWTSYPENVRVSYRSGTGYPTAQNNRIGIRCAKSAE